MEDYHPWMMMIHFSSTSIVSLFHWFNLKNPIQWFLHELIYYNWEKETVPDFTKLQLHEREKCNSASFRKSRTMRVTPVYQDCANGVTGAQSLCLRGPRLNRWGNGISIWTTAWVLLDNPRTREWENLS